MNKDDKDEVRDIVNDISKAYANEMIGRINVVIANQAIHSNSIERVEQKVTITNGKVAENVKEIELLKQANLVHVVNCPNTSEISKLKNSDSERQIFRKVLYGVFGAAGLIMGLIISSGKIVELFNSIFGS